MLGREPSEQGEGLSTNCLGQPSRPDRAGEFPVLKLGQESRRGQEVFRADKDTGGQVRRCERAEDAEGPAKGGLG